MQGPQGPIAAILAVAGEGVDEAGVGAMFRGQALHGHEIAFEIAAGQAQSRG